MNISRRNISQNPFPIRYAFHKAYCSRSLATLVIAATTAVFLWFESTSRLGSRSAPYLQTEVASTPFVSTPPSLSHQLEELLPSSTVKSTSCQDVRSRVQRGDWVDPNHGYVYARTLTSEPTFAMAVHEATYDSMRWKSIYEKGAYYETAVHERFLRILQSTTSQQKHIVLDLGMNIGYYTLLSAILGHVVVGFEINPANLMRVCESLSLNQINHHSPVAFFQRGVSNIDNQTLHLVVPKNPGEATLKATPASSSAAMMRRNDAADAVTTITLDTFAKEQGWFDSKPTIRLLKIDVEGHEPEIIQGARRLLQTGIVQNILTEYRNFASAKTRQAFDILLDAGYSLVVGGKLLTRSESEAYYQDLVRKRLYHDEALSWRKKVKTYLGLGTFYMDLWFSCLTCESEAAFAGSSYVES